MEVVVHPKPQDIVGKLRIPVIGPRKVGVHARPAEIAEIDMEIFGFPGPVFRTSRTGESALEPSACGPADLGRGRIEAPAARRAVARIKKRSGNAYFSVGQAGRAV